MTALRRLIHPWPVLMIVVSAAATSPAVAADWKFRADEHARIEVNGDAQTDARLLATDASGVYLVELPFESKYVLVNLSSRSAILLMRSEVKRVKSEGRDDEVVLDQRSALGTSSYTLRAGGDAFDFQTDISSVHVDLQRSKSDKDGGGAAPPPVATPTPKPSPTPMVAYATSATPEPPRPEAAPVADSDAARACVRLETIPSMLIPNCTQSVYVRNSCTRPVVALVSQTQHLMSGALSDAISIQVPPQGTAWVACSWWSGAMAPTVHDLVGAGFIGGHHGDRQGP